MDLCTLENCIRFAGRFRNEKGFISRITAVYTGLAWLGRLRGNGDRRVQVAGMDACCYDGIRLGLGLTKRETIPELEKQL